MLEAEGSQVVEGVGATVVAWLDVVGDDACFVLGLAAD